MICNVFINRIFLRWRKVGIQKIAIVGILFSMCGYLILTDWQAIPYDPCTEYSPFHHPELLQGNSSVLHTPTKTEHSIQYHLHSSIKLSFDNGLTVDEKFQINVNRHCKKASSKDCDSNVCLLYTSVNLKLVKWQELNKNNYEPYSCSQAPGSVVKVCVILPRTLLMQEPNLTNADIQSVQVLTDTQFQTASNTCISADIQNHKCRWIPFMLFTGKKCRDCPPICRGTHQTLTFPQYLIGIALLLIGYSHEWVAVLAISSNLTPKAYQVL